MQCRFGCQPERWVSNEEAMAITNELVGLWPSLTRDPFPYGNFGRNKFTSREALKKGLLLDPRIAR
jgi:hypothetical protein